MAQYRYTNAWISNISSTLGINRSPVQAIRDFHSLSEAPQELSLRNKDLREQEILA